MSKDRAEKRDKKEKKKSKRSETDGVKKSKKEKKPKYLTEDNIVTALEKVEKESVQKHVVIPDHEKKTSLPLEKEHEKKTTGDNISAAVAVVTEKVEKREKSVISQDQENTDVPVEKDSDLPRPIGNLVPFANPLADEKTTKKVLKSVKKASKVKTLKRGVKEVVKALRKSSQGVAITSAPGVVVLAADISPMDVISHIPILCEDHNVPYIFVKSRAELGSAGNTKRPTSVVMVSETRAGSKKKDVIEGNEEFKETYNQLVLIVEKEARKVRI